MSWASCQLSLQVVASYVCNCTLSHPPPHHSPALTHPPLKKNHSVPPAWTCWTRANFCNNVVVFQGQRCLFTWWRHRLIVNWLSWVSSTAASVATAMNENRKCPICLNFKSFFFHRDCVEERNMYILPTPFVFVFFDAELPIRAASGILCQKTSLV